MIKKAGITGGSGLIGKILIKILKIKKIKFSLYKKDIRNFKVSIKYDGPIKAPIKKNDQIGEIIVKTSDVENVIVPVYASEDVKKVNFIKSLFMSFNYMIWGDV